MTCTVVIPIYTTQLTPSERRSLAQCHTVLSRHRIVYATPQGLDLSALGDGLEQVAFDKSYFKSIHDYNRLMLSREFYSAFADSDYILIYQTDAWVFSDTLDDWCAKGYDYIGAPWLGKPWQLSAAYSIVLSVRRLWARMTGHGISALRKWHAGNGGLSLRRTRRFMEVLDELEYDPAELPYKDDAESNEDVIWSVTLRDRIKIPEWQEAMRFSVDSRPAWAMSQLQGKIPFGCHGWNKGPNTAFWQKIITE